MSQPLYLATPETGKYGTVIRDNGYFVVKTDSPAVLEMAKRCFPGCRTMRHEKKVRFPATRRAVCDLNWLLLRYPMEIQDRSGYLEKLEEARLHDERRKANLDLSEATPPATFTGTLYPFQAAGVSFLIGNKRTLLADDMGLGKTVTALAALATANAFPALVVAPSNVRRQWQRQAGAFLNIGEGLLFRDESGSSTAEILSGLKPYRLKGLPIAVIHYGLLRGWKDVLPDLGFRAVIFDEVQELRHTGTQKYSAASLLSSAAEYVWGLSGTPIYNYGAEMWAVTNALEFHCLGDRDSFTREWCTGYQTEIVERPEVLADHLKAEGLMLRRRKSEVSDLPPKRQVVEYIEHDEGLYAQMISKARDTAKRYGDITDWHEKGMAAREIEGESRMATGVSKAPYVAEFVSTLIEAGERPIVYAWHHAVHDALFDSLTTKGHWVERLTGAQTESEKDQALGKFRVGSADCIVISLRTAAGLDGLQGKGTCVVFAELDWSPAIHAQCEDRLHRVGVLVDSVLCYYLVSETGFDGVVLDALGLKVSQFTGLMGDEAKTEEDKEIAQAAAKKHLEEVIRRLAQ